MIASLQHSKPIQFSWFKGLDRLDLILSDPPYKLPKVINDGLVMIYNLSTAQISVSVNCQYHKYRNKPL